MLPANSDILDIYYEDRGTFGQIVANLQPMDKWSLALALDDPSLVDQDLPVDLFRIFQTVNEGASQIFAKFIADHPKLVESSIAYIVASLRFPMENGPLVIRLLLESEFQAIALQQIIYNLKRTIIEHKSQRFIRYLVDSGYFWNIIDVIYQAGDYKVLRDLSNWMLVNNNMDFQEISREMRKMVPK